MDLKINFPDINILVPSFPKMLLSLSNWFEKSTESTLSKSAIIQPGLGEYGHGS